MEQKAAAAHVGLGKVAYHGINSHAVLVAAQLVDVGHNLHLVSIDAAASVGYLRCVLVWHIIQHAQLGEVAQVVVHLLTRHATLFGQTFLVNGHIVGKNAQVLRMIMLSTRSSAELR